MSKDTFLNDHFLIAMPAMGDPNFHHSVTYICEHNAQGALGITINRPMNLNLGDIFDQLNLERSPDISESAPILLGGPVQPERGFVIHNPKGQWDSSMETGDQIQVTTSRDVLQAMARGEGPDQAIVALGYAGWTAGQLELEVVENAWLTVQSSHEILFETPYDKRWESAAALLGVDVKNISNYAGHA
ncbi:MAG: YqgE/AlgH family protein [Gammaproteobacteria bacterium]